ncbi:unnamed protein product, partial [Gulo gulo]
VLPGEIQARVREQQPESGEEAVVLVEGLQREPRKQRQRGLEVLPDDVSPHGTGEQSLKHQVEARPEELSLEEGSGCSSQQPPSQRSRRPKRGSQLWPKRGPAASQHQETAASATSFVSSWSQQVPVTLEDMAAYLSQEEWESPDPAQRDCSWDALPEHRGNVRRGPGHCSWVACLIWAGLREGGSFPRLAVAGWVQWARPLPGECAQQAAGCSLPSQGC